MNNLTIATQNSSSTIPKGWKLVFVLGDQMYPIKHNYWKGDSEGHAKAGRKGGLSQGKHNNSGNFANDKDRARRAGKKSKRGKSTTATN